MGVRLRYHRSATHHPSGRQGVNLWCPGKPSLDLDRACRGPAPRVVASHLYRRSGAYRVSLALNPG